MPVASAADPARRFASLIDAVLRRDWPSRVHFAADELPENDDGGEAVPGPRLSLCLAGVARYEVWQGGRRRVITVGRGEAVYCLPRCLLRVHEDSRYLSLGLVFNPGLTRYLLALKRRPASVGEREEQGWQSHRFLLAHHIPPRPDPGAQAFRDALARLAADDGGGGASGPSASGASAGTDDLYARRLLGLILIGAGKALPGDPAPAREGRAFFTWQAACQFVRDHLHEPIGREAVAAFLRLHPNHVSRLFRRFAGGSFGHHLLSARMERARQLLRCVPPPQVAEVARACGFSDPGYFARRYRRFFGEAPSCRRGR